MEMNTHLKLFLAAISVLFFIDGINSRVPEPTWSCPDSQLPNTTKIIRFFGTSYLHYNFARLPADGLEFSNHEELFFWFTTANPDGLIWLSQFGDHTMHLSMKSGYMMFVLSEGRNTPQIIYIRPRHQRGLHDWHWHKFQLVRDRTKVEFFIDDEKVVTDTIRSNVQLVTPGEVYLGGTPDTPDSTGRLVSENFDGALVDVHYSKTPRHNYNVKICMLQFLHEAESHGPISIIPWYDWGRNITHTQPWTTPPPPTTPRPLTTKLPYPITFVTEASLIKFGSLDLRGGGIINFRFRTNEPRGILLFNRGSTQDNFMAIEIFDGKLYFVYDFGSVRRRVLFANIQVDDGEWHEVIVDISDRNVRLTLDERYSQDIRQSYRPELYFGSLYIGGVEDNRILPWYVWSRRGFQGCIDGLEFKNIRININEPLQRAFLHGVRRGCETWQWHCSSQPCRQGSCQNRMDGYFCDCSNTPYSGRACGDDAVVAGMDGNQFGRLDFYERRITHTNDISFRFITALADGLLFQTVCDENDDFIRAELENGRIKVTVHVDNEEQVFHVGHNLNDYRWHTFYIRRRGGNLQMWVDDGELEKGVLNSEDFYIDVDRIYVGSVSGVNTQNYIGYMQNFWFDDINVFEKLQSYPDSHYNILLFLPDIGNLPVLTYHPVTITTESTYIELPTLRIGLTMRILFKFKTSEEDGLILFNQGRNNKFIAVELSKGLLRYVFDIGGRPQHITVKTTGKLNDNQWHTVWIQRVSSNQHQVNVDGTTHTVSSHSQDASFDLNGPLYIGGMPENLFSRHFVKKHIHSRRGFVGCLASFDLNGSVPELLQQAAGNQYIVDGCRSSVCLPGTCVNGGVCIPTATGHWCDCNMTSWVGNSCSEEATGLYFGKHNKDGIIVYTFPYELQQAYNEDRIVFGFMTRDENGALMRIDSATGNEFIEIKLENGYVVARYNTGSGTRELIVDDIRFNDGRYHVVNFVRMSNSSSLTVDNFPTIYQQHRRGVHSVLNAVYRVTIGAEKNVRGAMINTFNGIIAGHYWNGLRIVDAAVTYDGSVEWIGDVTIAPHPFYLVDFVTEKPDGGITGGPDVFICHPAMCINGGVCTPTINGYWCDCNMTSYVGATCSDEATGLYFGKHNKDGIIVYTFPYELQQAYDEDRIAFGFMTRDENALLMRIDSASENEFIEILLERGFIVARYNTGGGVQKMIVDNIKFNDGNYHVVKFIRTSSGSNLSVDSFPTIFHAHGEGTHSVLNAVYRVMIGAHQDSRGAMINTFNGIIAGHYWNGLRILDLAGRHDTLVEWTGDVTVAPHPFGLVDIVVTGKPFPTPPAGGPFGIPSDVGGGGVIGGPGAIGGQPGGIDGHVVAVDGGPGGGGLVVPPQGPAVAALTGAAGAPPAPVTGARAGAVLGSILGTMAFLSGLMWGFYKCKPGWCSCLRPGGAGPAGGATPVQISPPRAATNLSAVQAAGGGPGGAGSAAGTKMAAASGMEGSGAGGGAGGGGSAFSAHYQSSAMSAQSGGLGGGGGAGAGGAEAYDSATLRATGTFSNKGTVIGTPKAGRAHLGSSASAYSSTSQTTKSVFGSPAQPVSAGGGGSKMASYSYESSQMQGGPDYDHAGGMGSANYQSNTLSAGTGGAKYSTSTMSSYNYQVQNMRTVTVNRSGQQVIGYAGSTSGAVTPGAAADEVRVDCCLITADGNSVVTGSSLGPPQVWDMHTGELLRIMKGDTVGSTSLHLTCSDRLLVGAVHSDLEINEYSSRKGVFNHKLQIWDFVSGKPLEMDQQEYCSALCTMSDPDKVIFGRSAKYGNATNIVVWDLMGNQPIKEMQYDAPVGNNDYINFLGLSKNDRYVVAGFTNSFDNFAEFVIFDMTLTSYNVMEPSLLRLDANPECTVVLPQEEAVTGLRNGDLVVWSLRTGLPNRQLLMSNGGHAHSGEIKAVTLSENGKYLVSASADGTLKVWDMQNERLQTVLAGHNDEVWCCAISPDNEIVVSGSRDGTIRLWRSKNGQEICAFRTGVDVFFVTMSHDKSTIVALGDKFGARKLIMLQVVRTKIRRQLSA